VSPDTALAANVDVYAPCALGGVLDDESIPRLQCAVVAGAANNQLADAEAALVLSRRGIIYAPDFVANAGGAIHLVGREVLGWTEDQVTRRTLQIGQTLRSVFADARTHGTTPEQAAHDLAARHLADAA
jgi:leucine dehydrogenase